MEDLLNPHGEELVQGRGLVRGDLDQELLAPGTEVALDPPLLLGAARGEWISYIPERTNPSGTPARKPTRSSPRLANPTPLITIINSKPHSQPAIRQVNVTLALRAQLLAALRRVVIKSRHLTVADLLAAIVIGSRASAVSMSDQGCDRFELEPGLFEPTGIGRRVSPCCHILKIEISNSGSNPSATATRRANSRTPRN